MVGKGRAESGFGGGGGGVAPSHDFLKWLDDQKL